MSIQDEKHQISDSALEANSLDPDADETLDRYLAYQLELEKENGIKYRTCSWQKTLGLMFCEYICTAMLSFPWSFSVLGLIPGILLTAGTSVATFYVGLTILEFCIKNPGIRDICEVGQKLFGGKRWAWYITMVAFLINNVFIQALHVLVGSKYLNSISGHPFCTIIFAVITTSICAICSVPRTFSGISHLCSFAAITMFIALILCMIFAGVQDHPAGYDGTPVSWNLWPEKGTSFSSALNAYLNIVFTLAGQITYPSFIAEMRDPREFKKVLYITTVAEVILYCLAGAIIYVYAGNEYMATPGFGVLSGKYMKIAFSFAVPTIVILGVLFCTVNAKLIFNQLFQGTVHMSEHSVLGWTSWIGIILANWILAFIIAEVIPFFNDLLSVMSSLFTSWFGFIFWGLAYFQLRNEKLGKGWWKNTGWKGKVMIAWNLLIIVWGLLCLGPGLYAVIQDIIDSYRLGIVGSAFSCANNGFKG